MTETINTLAVVMVLGLLAWPTYWIIRLSTATPGLRRSILQQKLRIERRWEANAEMLGLFKWDQPGMMERFARPKGEKDHPFKRFPFLAVTPHEHGCQVLVKTVAGVGMDEFQKMAPALADIWDCQKVSVRRSAPGQLELQALRTDPLTTATTYGHDPIPAEALDRIAIGCDGQANPVGLQLRNVAGFGAYGVPGSGKTSLFLQIICKLAPSDSVQFVGLDGKVTDGHDGDYGDVADRFVTVVGDDLEEANTVLTKLSELRQWRSSMIRRELGAKNMWDAGGPSPAWPLVIVFIDEAQTYFEAPKGKDEKSKKLQELAAENERIVTDLVKKSRSVGILTVPATQKGTTDAIPSAIRDNLSASVCCAVRTRQAAVAALGDDITEYPDMSPVNLQGPEYVGVGTMLAEGRPGFTQVRFPYVSSETAQKVTDETKRLVKPGLLDVVPAGGGLQIAA